MPSLSVTIIARNEERNLARCLGSVADVADELVVTDTGSTDGTLDIARQFGARIGQFAWIDDFAAAHNYCLRLATSDWILMLDADEELLPTSQEALLNCLGQADALAFAVLRQDLVDARLDHYTEMWQMRLIRNRPDLHLVGRCHHHFSPPLSEVAARDGLAIRESAVRLRHYGYQVELRKEKLDRAARLLELELAERPNQFYYLVELSRTLLAKGDARGLERLAQAAELFLAGDQQATDARGQLAMLLEQILAMPAIPSGFPISRAAALQLAATRFPNSVPLLWQLAAQHERQKRYAECARVLEEILRLGQTGRYDRSVSFDPAIMTDDARLNLGVCYVRLGRVQAARKLFHELAASPTRAQQAADNLKALAGLKRR